jgi:hypothetical protein
MCLKQTRKVDKNLSLAVSKKTLSNTSSKGLRSQERGNEDPG